MQLPTLPLLALLGVLALPLLGAGCGKPKLRDGVYGCSSALGLGCPTGMRCLPVPGVGGEERCYLGHPDGGLPDGAPPDGALPDASLHDGSLSDASPGDGSLPDASGPLEVLEALQIGGIEDERLGGMAVDSAGDITLVGSHWGFFSLLGMEVPHTEGADAFAAKITPDGVAIWGHGWGTVGNQLGLSVAQRSENDEHMTYITGTYTGVMQVQLPGENVSLTAGYGAEGFLIRIGESTGPNAVMEYRGIGDQHLAPIAAGQITEQGLFITGWTPSDMSIAGGTVEPDGIETGFLARIYGGTSPDWVTTFSPTPGATSRGLGLATDPSDRVAVVGRYTEQLSMDSDSALNQGGTDAFVALFGLTGPGISLLWLETVGSAGEEIASAVAFSGASYLVVAGTFSASMTVGGSFNLVASGGEPDIFVIKYHLANGNIAWAQSFPTDEVSDLLLVAHGDHLYLGGNLNGTAFFERELVSRGVDGFVVKLHASTGTPLFSRLLGDDASPEVHPQHLRAMAMSPSGLLMVAGDFEGNIDLGSMPLMSEGGSDIFVATLQP